MHKLMHSICAQVFQPTHLQPISESFSQCHLILRKVKIAAVERDFVVLEGRGGRRAADAPTLKTYIKTNSSVAHIHNTFCCMLAVQYFAANPGMSAPEKEK